MTERPSLMRRVHNHLLDKGPAYSLIAGVEVGAYSADKGNLPLEVGGLGLAAVSAGYMVFEIVRAGKNNRRDNNK